MPQMLGVRIDDIAGDAASKKVSEFLNSSGQHTIFTPNPEMLVDAQKDGYFKTVLNSGSLNICDGKGIQLFSLLIGKKIERITGIDFMLDICKLAEKEGRGIYLLGSGSDRVVKMTAEKLRGLFPKLQIAGFDKGPIIKNIKILKYYNIPDIENGSINEQLLAKINAVEPEIIFVAFGHNKQEKWIHENLQKLPSVKVAMGVGGAFDYISGKVKRAPLFLRRIGLEWMYRTVMQPRRFKRIIKATVLFTIFFVKSKCKYQNTK